MMNKLHSSFLQKVYKIGDSIEYKNVYLKSKLLKIIINNKKKIKKFQIP